MLKRLKIYYMGAGDISVPVLEAISQDPRLEVVGIATQPDRPKGRKGEATASPVGEYAIKHLMQIPLSKPISVNTDDFIESVRALAPDLILVLAFGQLLKEPILKLPPFGCINIHTSLLPKYRGASPINAAILNGDAMTGVTIMQMEKGLDSGPIFQQIPVPLKGDETYFSLEKTLGEVASTHIAQCLLEIANGLTSQIQDSTQATHVGKIAKTDGQADWQKSAVELERISRAYYPWPTLYFELGSGDKARKISVVKAQVVEQSGTPGETLQANKEGWIIACGEKSLQIIELIPAGSRAMSATEFLRGYQK